MGYTIALAGKGGTGKTTIAGLLVRILKERKSGSILAIDADPNNNLAEVLGIKISETIGTILDDVAAHPDEIPAGMTKDRFIEYKVQSAVYEAQGFDILTMGKPEGPGCYCYVNNVLRNVMSKLIKDYDYVIIDNEAGLEHLSRRTTRQADTLLVVSDATPVGLRAAGRINELAGELKITIRNRFLLVNRYDKDLEKEKIKNTGLDMIGQLPVDEQLTKISLNGNSLMELKKDAPLLAKLITLGDRLCKS
ncbi:MAG: AAA family ATPase [Candidatus Omnitrophica bacterium]|nr:AAA family ATPase [Candidatus Omnitrophota bacterium]